MGQAKRRLGRTGLIVSERGLGTWAIGGSRGMWAYGPADDRQSAASIRRAFDLGCTYYDTADVYGSGHSEDLLGQTLASHRAAVVIATKGGLDFYHGEARPNYTGAYLRLALHNSLRRLRTDYVDVYQLHNPPVDVHQETDAVEELLRLRERGLVLHVGVSAATPEDAYDFAVAGWPDVIQLPYNMLEPSAEKVFPMAASRDIGIVVREALANGFLAGRAPSHRTYPRGDIRALWPEHVRRDTSIRAEAARAYCRPGETPAQLALRFALEPREVSVVVCGCRTPTQVSENLASPARVQGARACAARSPVVHGA